VERRASVLALGYARAVSRRAILRLAFCTTAGWAATFAGCTDDAGTGGGAPEHTDVVFEGGATPEALDALLAKTPAHDPTKTAVFDWPSDGELLSADTPSSFCWHIGEPASSTVPVPGAVYYITFTGPDGAMLHRGLTTATNFVPSAEAWDEMKVADVPITVVVTWAELQSDQVIEGGGPWTGKPITVRIRAF
jgi:hypothetical protein